MISFFNSSFTEEVSWFDDKKSERWMVFSSEEEETKYWQNEILINCGLRNSRQILNKIYFSVTKAEPFLLDSFNSVFFLKLVYNFFLRCNVEFDLKLDLEDINFDEFDSLERLENKLSNVIEVIKSLSISDFSKGFPDGSEIFPLIYIDVDSAREILKKMYSTIQEQKGFLLNFGESKLAFELVYNFLHNFESEHDLPLNLGNIDFYTIISDELLKNKLAEVLEIVNKEIDNRDCLSMLE